MYQVKVQTRVYSFKISCGNRGTYGLNSGGDIVINIQSTMKVSKVPAEFTDSVAQHVTMH